MDVDDLLDKAVKRTPSVLTHLIAVGVAGAVQYKSYVGWLLQAMSR